MTSFSTLFGPLGETFAAGPLPAANLIWCDQKIQIKTLLFRASFGKNARRNAQQRTIVATGAEIHKNKRFLRALFFAKVQQGPDPIPAQAIKRVDSPIRTCAPSQKRKLPINESISTGYGSISRHTLARHSRHNLKSPPGPIFAGKGTAAKPI